MTKEGLAKEKKIRALKKELAAQQKITREIEASKMPSENLIKVKPLMDGMTAAKQKLADEVLTMVEQFIGALLMITIEEKKSEDVVPERIHLLKVLESRRPIMMRIETIQNLGPEDTKFGDDYWFYLGALNQVVMHW